MKYLTLTKEIAEHLNEMLQFVIDKVGIYQDIDLSYYHRNKPQLDFLYCRHILDVANQYENFGLIMQIRELQFCATYNTKYFLNHGGFLQIVQQEDREEKIQTYTEKSLKQSIFATSDWWKLFLITTSVSILVTILGLIISHN